MHTKRLLIFFIILNNSFLEVDAQKLENGTYQLVEIDNCARKLDLSDKEEQLMIEIKNYSRYRKLFTKFDGRLLFSLQSKSHSDSNNHIFNVLFKYENNTIQLQWPDVLQYANELDTIHVQLTPWLWESCNSSGTIEFLNAEAIRFTMSEINHSQKKVCYQLTLKKHDKSSLKH
jgi:hypothetical protein